MRLESTLDSVKGVGLKTAEQFELAGIRTVGELINFLPRRFEDYSKVVSITDITPGKMTIKVKCEKATTRIVKRGMRVTTAVLYDDTGKLNAVWFNQPYRVKQLETNDEFYVSGEFEFRYGRYQLTSPSVELVKEMPVQTDRLLPIYRQIKGLKSQLVRKILAELKPIITMLPETLPDKLLKQEKLISRADAFLGMHFPDSIKQHEKAHQRLAFEELFELLLASQYNRQANSKLTGWHVPFEQTIVKQFVEKLPFELTAGQRRAAWDILQDFEQKVPMNRLLQGDVGSGKTVVAGLAARQAASHGFQTAIMAPTEILAMQHATTLANLLEPFGVDVGFLAGSVKGKNRDILLQKIATGEVDILVGTHAIFEDKVKFSRLGFVVIDEQHRFGVEQRQKLLAKSKHLPHLLAMTATPIPRSLALTVYGELDISVLRDMPKNRLPIKTKLVSPNSVQPVYQSIDAEIASGRQAYVVCSLIDDNPDNDLKSVQKEYDNLRKTVFKHRKIGLLHGKMKPLEKESVMQDFKDNKYDILVSTTVVEVGVDVPNATVMMIENADNFGLSQLHQLRGRVGRSTHQSYCYLIMSDSSAPKPRLKEIEKSTDGFYLAEVDMRLRGPGEIYGRAQHGALNLQVASLADTELISRATRQAKSFVSNDTDLVQYKQLAAKVKYYQRLTTLN